MLARSSVRYGRGQRFRGPPRIAIATLISLQWKKLIDSDGDKLDFFVWVDDGLSRTEGMKLSPAIPLIVFDALERIRRLDFGRQVRIEIQKCDDFTGEQIDTGTVFIAPDEAGLGRRTQHFTDNGADYVLTYEVAAG
jgi:hypothetical protein